MTERAKQETSQRLWLISQDENENYDTYDSAVVAAATEQEARETHPSGDPADWGKSYSGWCKSPDQVKATLIGVASRGVQPGVVIASFNAG